MKYSATTDFQLVGETAKWRLVPRWTVDTVNQELTKFEPRSEYRLRGDSTVGKPKGRVYFDPLNRHFTLGTPQDLEQEQICPAEGMTVLFCNNDADENGNEDNPIFEGVIHFDKNAARWSAVIDEKSYRHE